jgi:hypothetical protein
MCAPLGEVRAYIHDFAEKMCLIALRDIVKLFYTRRGSIKKIAYDFLLEKWPFMDRH